MFNPIWLRDSTVSTVTAGWVTVLVGFTSSVALIFQAAQTLGADNAIISSWMWALGIGMGLSSLGLSWYYKVPICTAWSTPGAALLITALSGYSMPEAIGAFILSSALIILSGITGFFERFMDKIPKTIGAAMLAGVLVNFGIKVFTSIQENLVLGLIMLTVYLVFKQFIPKFAILCVLITGMGVCLIQGNLNLGDIEVAMANPIFITPTFSLKAAISIALPLFIVTMTAQNIPGVTVLRTFGYRAPTSAAVTTTGTIGLILAPFGCFALNLAAITAAICMSDDVHQDKSKRYIAGIWTGIFYLIIGFWGATVASTFSAFPTIFVATLAGLALFTTIGNSLTLALSEEKSREAALITFLTTASGLTLFGIGSAFWGIVMGLIALLIFSLKKPAAH